MTTPDESSQAPTVAVLVKAVQVLRALAASEHPLGPTELARLTGIDRSAVHRILTTLARERFVERVDATGAYTLGLGLAALGLAASSHLDLRKVARPHMEALFARFSETVNLAVLDDDAVLYVDMIETHRGLRMAASVATRDSLVTTALGKAMLACLPPQRAAALVARQSFVPRTPKSTRFPDELLRSLDEIRARGYAIDDEENELGACCLGAPIFGPEHEVIGAVSVSVPKVRLDERRQHELATYVVRTASDISQALGLPDFAPRGDSGVTLVPSDLKSGRVGGALP